MTELLRLKPPGAIPRRLTPNDSGKIITFYSIWFTPRLFGLDDVFVFVGLLAHEVDRMFEEAERAVLTGPAVIAVAVIAREHALRRGTDLLRRLELSLGNAAFEFSSLGRTRSIALMRCLRSKAWRSSEWTTNTRTPGWFEGTCWTSVLGDDAFSRAVMPTGHSIHGPVALWI
jgi:hypothetical protein